jgi:hypothetical protein
LIDEALRASGWEVDSVVFRHAAARVRSSGGTWPLRNGRPRPAPLIMPCFWMAVASG